MSDKDYITDDSSSDFVLEKGKSIKIDLDTLQSGRFTNIRKIYASPAGTAIYAATRYGKRYILKGIDSDSRDNMLCNVSLAKEFEIGISLDHQNIRRTIGFEEIPDLGKVIILEYFDGVSLEDFIKTGRLTSRTARLAASQIASALKYIHSKQVIHKDLKLSNILITHQGDSVKLIDFNLADSDQFVILKNPAGTARYMAPEQRKADAKPSVANDVYSFGVVVKELARAAGDPELMEVGKACTMENPRMRPQSMDEISLPDSNRNPSTPLSRFLSSKLLTALCILICMMLSIYICYLATSKHLI